MRTLALLLAVSTPAFAADQVGRDGVIETLSTFQSTADTYLAMHGALVLATAAGAEEYKWGGTACGSRVLSDRHVQMLQRAMDSGATVGPRFKPGQGSSRCLVGFVLSYP
jgi:hypothetical protein